MAIQAHAARTNTTMTNTEILKSLYPFQSNFLDIDGLRYHYLDEGKGPVVLMLHGNPTWSFYYRDLAAELRRTHRVIVPDHIGCGLSDKPQSYPYHMADHLRNVTALIEHLEIKRFSLVMHDWGGPIGLSYAVDHPSQVDRCVVFNSTPMETRGLPMRILACKLPLFGNIAIRGFNAFARGASHMATWNAARMTPAVRHGYLIPYDSWANRVATLRFVQDIPMSDRHPSAALIARVRSQLGTIADKPMLICWGKRDFCFTEQFLDRWRECFPAAVVHQFANAGHYVLEDAFDEILPLVTGFLSGCNRAATVQEGRGTSEG